jgi:HEAT repeats
MLDSKQVKNLGLRFARALQMTIKTATVFTIEHRSAEGPIQQSFLLLNNLLKDVGQLTFGFVDNQVILNNLLTTDQSLQKLETEFLKRGVAAVTFEPGLTLGRYRKVIHVLSASTAAIDAAGGFLALIDQNEIEGVRILPAARNQKKNQDGDTILETDSESYILSKQTVEDQAPRDFLDSIDALLESGGFDPSTRTEVLSTFATHGMDGSGYGVPVDVPKLAVVRDGEVIAPAGSQPAGSEVVSGTSGGGGGHALYAAAGQGHGPFHSGGEPGVIGQSGRSVNSGTFADGMIGGASIAYGAPTSSEIGVAVGGLGARGRGASSGPSTFLELVEASVQRSLQQDNGDPSKSYASLARILRNTGVDKILEQFPAERRQELSALPPERLAAEYIEDTALKLAGMKIQSSGGTPRKILVEEEVVFLLGRSLQATHMADRLAQKLTKFIQDFAIPPHIQEKIREELQWTSFNSNKKYSRLMELARFSNIEFRRLQEFLKELVTQRDLERATALVSHYFDFLDDPQAVIDSHDLSRAPDLLGTVPLAHAEFTSKTAERLSRTLSRTDVSELVHLQVANAITKLAQSAAAFENFQDVLAIASSLEASHNRNREKHKNCCGAGLAGLLSRAAVERIIELYLAQRGDSAWSRTAATLLRFAAPSSIQNVMDRLVQEADARNRLALLRLASQLGSASIEIALKYLSDERWYVVRNMCGVLAELRDPQLAEHVAPALRHSDVRVQRAALKALCKTLSTNTAQTLADAIPMLAPQVLDEALDQLLYLKNPNTISSLEKFVPSSGGNVVRATKAVRALGAIEESAALSALARLFRIEELDLAIRRAALNAIACQKSPSATLLLQELAAIGGPLGDEVKKELAKRAPEQS